MTTCRSDEDDWAKLERMARLRDLLDRLCVFFGMMFAEALILLVVLYFVARSAMPMNRDTWHVILDAAGDGSAERDE